MAGSVLTPTLTACDATFAVDHPLDGFGRRVARLPRPRPLVIAKLCPPVVAVVPKHGSVIKPTPKPRKQVAKQPALTKIFGLLAVGAVMEVVGRTELDA